MAENLFGNAGGGCRETVCIDTYRVLDSCRDRDCFKDVKCYLTSFGQDMIERTNTVRTKYAKVLSAYIDIDQVPFNTGFYQLTSRIFIKVICEACLGPGNVQDFEGICAVDKKVVLYGGEGSVNVFKSTPGCNSFCPDANLETCKANDTLPIAVIETVDPIVLDTKVREPHHHCHSCCPCCDIPDNVLRYIGGDLIDCERPKMLNISFGLFSVLRIERPAQLLVSAAEYNVPEKQCTEATEDDPCSLFNGIPFPEKEFNSTSVKPSLNQPRCGCGS